MSKANNNAMGEERHSGKGFPFFFHQRACCKLTVTFMKPSWLLPVEHSIGSCDRQKLDLILRSEDFFSSLVSGWRYPA